MITQNDYTRTYVMNEKDEEWKDVLGYEGIYQVSKSGKVRSLDRIVRNKHGQRNRSGKTLNPTLYHGYPKVYLRRKSVFVHRVVAETFLEKPEGKNIVVNHKNGIKTDNMVENLEWCTQSENVLHALKTGLSKIKIGGKNKKLDEMQILAIVTIKKQRELARHYSVSQSVIQNLLKGNTYKAVTKGIL